MTGIGFGFGGANGVGFGFGGAICVGFGFGGAIGIGLCFTFGLSLSFSINDVGFSLQDAIVDPDAVVVGHAKSFAFGIFMRKPLENTMQIPCGISSRALPLTFVCKLCTCTGHLD